jgi:cAMP-specific phosphodiesterase
MSLSALLEEQRRTLERTRLTTPGVGERSKQVLFPRDYLSSRNGGVRPSSRASSSLEMDAGGKASRLSPLRSTGTPQPSNPSSHLHEALSLTLSILKRYRREHLTISPEDAVLLAEVAGFHTDVSPGAKAPKSPPEGCITPSDNSVESTALPTLTRRRSRDLLQKIRGVVHAPQMYKDMVTSKTNVRNLTQFAVECSTKSTDLAALAGVILEQLQAALSVEDRSPIAVDLFLVDNKGRDDTHVPMVNIVRREATIVRHDDVLCRTGALHFDSAGGYLPMVADNELHAVAHFPGATAADFDDARTQTLNAVVGIACLSLRTAAQFERIELQRSKNAEMLLMVRNIASTQLAEVQIIETIMDSAKALVNAAHCSFFFVEAGAITQRSRLNRSNSSTNGLGDSTDQGIQTALSAESFDIATAVARTGESTVVNDLQELTASTLERLTGVKMRNVLCLPVKGSNGEVIGVAQLSNKEPALFGGVMTPQRFTALDEALFNAYANFAAISLANARSKSELLTEKLKSEAILGVVQYLSDCDIRDVNSVVARVMKGAKDLLCADRASLFLIDEERDELYSKVADATGGREIRVPIGKGIAGMVAKTGAAELIDDAYVDERFNREVDKQLGYRTRTMLAEPISFRGDILAVAQLVNKLDPETKEVVHFTKADQETFRTFAMFAGISLSNSRLVEFVIKAGEEAMALNVQFDAGGSLNRKPSSNARITVTDVERRRVRDAELTEDEKLMLITNEFNLFGVRERASGASVARDLGCKVVVEIFRATGYLEKFHVDEETLYNFVIRCRSKYRSVPYHNFFHAVDAVQTIYTYLFIGRAKDKLTDLECFVLLIAALCHDLDHMGLNNNFHLKTDSPLGILSSASGNKSVLEVHHCNLAVEILQDPTSNMFEALDRESAATAYRTLIDAILATDMARHGDLLETFKNISDEGYDMTRPEHRTCLVQMLLKAADISNVTKPFDVSRLWAISVTEEFYQQGDKEREQGVEVNPMFDRTRGTELAKGQIGFISFIANKFFSLVTGENAIEGMAWCARNIQSNVATWQSMLTN